MVQIGSWLAEATAHTVAGEFTANGVNVTVSHVNDKDGRTWYVIRSGDFATANDANALRDSIRAIGGVSPIVVRLRASPAASSPAA